MPEEFDKDRVKPCLACDRMIPFKAGTCPFCRSIQPFEHETEAARSCSNCSKTNPSWALYCPSCQKLTDPNLCAPSSGLAEERPAISRGIGMEFLLYAALFGAILLQAGILVDYLLLGI